MNDDSLMDRMFRTFDSDADGYLNCKEWLYGLWIFLKGNLVEKATYSFQVVVIGPFQFYYIMIASFVVVLFSYDYILNRLFYYRQP